MRIISKFKDYYDGCQSLGVDKEIKYVRNTQKLTAVPTQLHDIYMKLMPFKLYSSDMDISYDGWSNHYVSVVNRLLRGYKAQWVVIVFCGKLYVCIHIQLTSITYPMPPISSYLCCNTDEVYGVISELTTLSDQQKGLLDRAKSDTSMWTDIINNPINVSGVCVECDSPVIIVGFNIDGDPSPLRDNKLQCVINPCLVDYQFQRVVDSYTAYQELSMFIPTVLTSNDSASMLNISDVHMRDSKGFNDVSFKTRIPSTKSRKRKKQLKRNQSQYED